MGITCDNCQEDPARGMFCSPNGDPICEERPAEGIFCHDVPPSCIHEPNEGLMCDANHKQQYEVDCIPDLINGVSCAADGQTCVTVLSREVCQNDFSMDDFDENNFQPEELRFIDDEDEMGRLEPEFFKTMNPEDFDQFPDDAYGNMTSLQVAQLAPEAFEGLDGRELFNFDPNVFDDFKPEQVQKLPPQSFSGLTALQFNRFDANTLSSMNDEQIRNVPKDVWGGINEDVFFGMPPSVFDDLDADDCENLPPSIFAKLDQSSMGQLGEHCLMGMEDEDFLLLPEDALAGLNTVNLAGLPPRVINDFTPEKFKKLNPESLNHLRDNRPLDMMEIIANLGTVSADGVSADDIDMVKGFLPPGLQMDPSTGEFMFVDDIAFEGTLPFPELEVREDDMFGDLAGRITFHPPFDMNKGFGLGGAGDSGVSLLKEAMDMAFPGFNFRQDEEGFIELFGEGDFAGVEFDLVVENVKQAPPGAQPGLLETDPFTGVFRLTTRNGVQFELAMGPPNMTCMAKGLGDHDINYTDENVMIFKPKPTTTTGRREDNSNSTPVPGRSAGKGKRRRAGQTPGLTRFPATQPGERPYAELVYADDVGIDDCAGFVQTISPTVPNGSEFVELLSGIFAKEDLYRHVNGSIRLRFDANNDGVKELYEIVPGFPTAATTITRGNVEQHRLAQNADGSFKQDGLGRFQYMYPYDGELITIPLGLAVVVE